MIFSDLLFAASVLPSSFFAAAFSSFFLAGAALKFIPPSRIVSGALLKASPEIVPYTVGLW